MSKNIFIKNLNPGDQIRDIFILAQADKGQARNGPYWKLVFQDSTGRIDGVIWSPLSEEYPSLESGQYVLVQGQVNSFKEKNQIRVERLEILQALPKNVDHSDFLQSSHRPANDMLEEIEDLITEHMVHKPWKSLCRRILKDETIRPRLLAATGAKTVHHAYAGGLLEHTLGVVRLCMAACDQHPELDRQVLLAAAIFHDLGKAWELTGGVENVHTDPGRLMGHIQLGLEVLDPFLNRAKTLEPELILHFKHLILSHHGEYEYGAPVLPKTAEALVLHHMDNLDAKLNMVNAALDDLNGEGQRWSPYLRYLERNVYKPFQSPDPSRSPANNETPENQCLLPLKG